MTKEIKRRASETVGDGPAGRLSAPRGAGRLGGAEIGRRLRIARKSARMTQAEAAERIDVSRTTLVAVERGLRPAGTEELQRLAALYGTSANAMLRREAVHVDLVPRFRRLRQSEDDAVNRAADLLNRLAGAETELENVLGVGRARRYPPERPILPGDVEAQAEANAQELRDRLGIGSGPVPDIVSLLDRRLGVRVYARKIDHGISGLFACEESVGACVLLNANHPVDRMRQTAAHELGHFCSTRERAEVLTEDEKFRSREERYADRFARAFLTPARGVAESFAGITDGQSHFTRRHVILLAHEHKVSREAMVRRLEELSLVGKGTWEWFEANGKITDRQAEEVLGPLPPRHVSPSVAGDVLPPRLTLLAREAWKRDFYSEGQLARLLDLGRVEVRKMLADMGQEEANDLFRLPR